MSPEEKKDGPPVKEDQTENGSAGAGKGPKAAAPAASAKPAPPEAGGGAPAEESPEPPAPEWEAELDSYPLREPKEDARWALNTVRVWMGIAIGCLIGIIILLILGLYYD